MKRLLAAALIAASIATATPANAATPDRWRGPCEGWWMGETLKPADWHGTLERREVAVHRIERLIVCVFGTYAPGQSIYALAIADRESNLYPWAWNQSSDCRGLYQHMGRYWSGRVTTYLDRWMFGAGAWPPSAFDARANAIVAAKMVGPGGNWGPWSL